MLLKRSLAALATTLVAVCALAGCSDDSSSPQASDTAPTADQTGPPCTYTSDGAAAAKKVDLPPDHATGGSVDVTIATGVGDIQATLDGDATPCTVNSFVSLAKQGYFDGTTCHRLTTSGIYVLQCGDPTATGSGGPGYSFADELTGNEKYGPGTLAMANAGPDTNGSQFFIVYSNSQLPPSYTVFGTIDDAGLKTIKDVADQGTTDGGPDGAPRQPVDIKTVTVD